MHRRKSEWSPITWSCVNCRGVYDWYWHVPQYQDSLIFKTMMSIFTGQCRISPEGKFDKCFWLHKRSILDTYMRMFVGSYRPVEYWMQWARETKLRYLMCPISLIFYKSFQKFQSEWNTIFNKCTSLHMNIFHTVCDPFFLVLNWLKISFTKVCWIVLPENIWK